MVLGYLLFIKKVDEVVGFVGYGFIVGDYDDGCVLFLIEVYEDVYDFVVYGGV